MKLIYHKEKDIISAFDSEIVEICKNEEVNIVCPYISIDYLKSRISKVKNWKLITDLKEWIISNNNEERKKIWDFIKDNNSMIHHCKDIHAKIIFNNNFALVGSANFTNKGIRERIEMSVLIEEEEKIIELKKWFSELWNDTQSISLEEINKFISSVKDIFPYKVHNEDIANIQGKSPKINKKLNSFDIKNELFKEYFRINEFYNRIDIFNVLGGSQQSYLPDKNGKVLSACITPKLNDSIDENSPVILVGYGGNIEKTGYMLSKQKDPIPVFIKRKKPISRENNWKFIGIFKVDYVTKDEKEITPYFNKVEREHFPLMAIIMKKI